MRNIVVHDYCKTDEKVIWATAAEDLKGLITQLTEMAKILRAD